MLFGKRKKPKNEKLIASHLDAALQNPERDDPLVRARVASKAVKTHIFDVMQRLDSKGVHVETAIGILGSLAGFSCAVCAHRAFREGYGANDPNAFIVLTGADGQNYYFGNLLNLLLLESSNSVWRLMAGKAQHLGVIQMPDVQEIAKHTASTVGGDMFGIPRLPAGHGMFDLPRNYVRWIWPTLIDEVSGITKDPVLTSAAFSLTIQDVMQEFRDILDPGLSAQIAMECAVPMSKIDPDTAF